MSDSDDKLETLIFFGVLACIGVFIMLDAIKHRVEIWVGNLEAIVARHPGRTAFVCAVASLVVIVLIIA